MVILNLNILYQKKNKNKEKKTKIYKRYYEERDDDEYNFHNDIDGASESNEESDNSNDDDYSNDVNYEKK